MAEIFIGLLAGVAAGMGTGGGALLTPALVLFLGVPLLTAQAIALVGFLPAAAVATVVHARKKRLHWPTIGWIFLGSIPGIGGGLLLTLIISPQWLRRIYAVLVIILACYLLFSAIRKPQPKASPRSSAENI